MMIEGEGRSEMEYTEIETNADSLDNSVKFHVVKNVLAFILYMHQQIPSVLQDIRLEFESLKVEFNELEMALAQAEAKASIRRKHLSRKREVKGGIRRLDKLMNTVSGLECALQLIISEIPNLESFLLVLGASPIRPQHVYEICVSHGKTVLTGATDFAASKAAEGLSRKTIRALIAKGAGSGSYPGPTKLFILAKAPSSFNQPLHFLPKRDFRFSKKIVPVRLRLKCKRQYLDVDVPDCACQTSSSISTNNSASKELIWFQCRHVIRGLAFTTAVEE